MLDPSDPTTYYAAHGKMSDPGEFSPLLEHLPGDISGLRDIVQNNLIHVFWAARYGLSLTEPQKRTLNLRRFSEKLALLKADGAGTLSEHREIHSRQVGNCRDFSLFLTALLRHQGIPARSRCGFARYFLPDHFEDHWVCEYWNKQEECWILVDAQLDSLQLKTLDIRFNPLDVPPDQFISGGQAWQMCRSGDASPEKFGIFDMHGWWFIWGDVIRDFLSLNKIEILPWDGGWGYLLRDLADPLAPEEQLVDYDKIGALSADPYSSFEQLRSLFNNDSRFRIPDGY